jgi:hypothetical protein
LKIYCFYTAAYQDLVDQWLGPSIALEYELVAHRGPDATAIDYKRNGWASIVRRKVDFILEAVRDNWNQPFVFSDPDVQLLGPTRTRLSHLIRCRDLVFQKDSPRPDALCTGFFVCRGNSKTLKFWTAVRDQMDGAEDRDDQDCARAELVDSLIGRVPDRSRLIAACLSQHRVNPFAIRWGYLPVLFFGGGTLTGLRWRPGDTLPVPDPVLMHHANWTVGLANKVAQLHHVSAVVDARRSTAC